MRPQSDLAELHAWAADETATLVSRFADVRTRAIARDLDAMRKAFDAAVRSIEASLATPAQAKDEIGTFVERLTTHVGLDAIRTQLQEREVDNQTLKSMLTNARMELEAARHDVETARHDAEAARHDVETARQDAEAARHDVETARHDAKAARHDAEAARHDVEAARYDAEAARGDAEAARQEVEAARHDFQTERGRAESTQADAAKMAADFERALDELHREHATVVAEQAVACTSLPLDELLTVFSALRKTATVPELLTTLIDGLTREFSRVALFEVDGDQLLGAEQVGFDLDGGDISTVSIPLDVDSMLTRAVSTGRFETIIMGLRNETGTTLPFGGTPACALAMPIIVQGATTAVIYADDSDHVEFATAAPHSRAKFAELLQQHALLVLVRIWVEQKSVAGLRELAAKMVVDLEYTYQVEAEAGRNRLQCQQRLKDDVESARKRYAERAGEDRQAGPLLEEHLAAAAVARKDSAFCQDLAAVLGSANHGVRANVVSMYR